MGKRFEKEESASSLVVRALTTSPESRLIMELTVSTCMTCPLQKSPHLERESQSFDLHPNLDPVGMLGIDLV